MKICFILGVFETFRVPVDIQATMICAIVANSTSLDFIRARYSELPAESTVRPRIRNAMGCASSPALIQG
jgi:hypothetical protein